MAVMLSNETAPKVSVLIPVYNSERYLAAAIESILDQTFRDFELIAIDDGSTDKSLETLRCYQAKDSRLRVLAREHRGISPTRNELNDLAQGQYLALMDSDDICLPARLEKQIEYLDAHVDCVAVGGWVEHINAKGQPIRIMDYPLSHQEIDNRNLEGCTAIVQPAAMVRREAMLAVGSYRLVAELSEDLDLWLRLAEMGQLANVQNILLKYRIHGGSVSESRLEQQYSAAVRVCEDAWQRRGIKRQFLAKKIGALPLILLHGTESW